MTTVVYPMAHIGSRITYLQFTLKLALGYFLRISGSHIMTYTVSTAVDLPFVLLIGRRRSILNMAPVITGIPP